MAAGIFLAMVLTVGDELRFDGRLRGLVAKLTKAPGISASRQHEMKACCPSGKRQNAGGRLQPSVTSA